MEGSTIKSRIRSLLRSPSIKLKRNRLLIKDNLTNKVTLERVLGITTSGSCGLTCDPCTGTVAYPAGCVVVLLNPKRNRQQHIINMSRKTITTLAFSSDGKYLVTGESGHLPAVRVWDVAEGSQVAELQEHKFGVSCVAFSPNSKYIVSVGYQHDMSVNVWAWKKNTLVAANKVSSKVTAVSFSEDSSYFVTAGNRHVRFWYLEPNNSNKQLTTPVPLLGRSGLLGEMQNNNFCDVACGRGEKSASTFCITSSGLLCEFSKKRMLDKWVDLQTSAARALCVTEELIFCACADGTVRVFNPSDLRFICSLPRPHHLGMDVAAVTQASHLFSNKLDARYPDSVAVTYDPVNLWLSCVYNDHSLYVWDVQDLNRVGKVHSALYHSACVWDLQTYAKGAEGPQSGFAAPGVFFSCSADNTIRMWSTEAQNCTNSNVLSSDLCKIIYVDSNTAPLLDVEGTASSGTEKSEGQTTESRTGIRTICVSPDGKHVASGDRSGILRVHDLSSMEEILRVEAHDSEILCLEYSKPETGVKLLATAGRDRLIHVLDVEEDYDLLQTLDEHSSSITAVRFAAHEGKVRMVSCGADKSIYFRTAHRTSSRVNFKRTHHVARKSTIYDMDVDPTCKYAAVGCQDRSIRVFNISNGKQKKSFKGSQTEDGSLLRVQLDPSGLYVATSCSDKNLSLFDFQTGECLAAMFGHSEIITSIKFTSDCRHLISTSGDSCVFIWRLAPELTINMRERMAQIKRWQAVPVFTDTGFRRYSASSLELHSVMSIKTCSSESEEDNDQEKFEKIQPQDDNDSITHIQLEENQGASDEESDWDSSSKFQDSSTGSGGSEAAPRPRRRWSCRMGSLELMVKSMLELRHFDSSSRPGSPGSICSGQFSSCQAKSSTASLQEDALMQEQGKKRHVHPHSAWLAPASSPEPDGVVLYPELCPSIASMPGVYQIQGEEARLQDSHSPDCGSSMGYGSGGSSPDRGHGDDPEPLSTDDEEVVGGRPFPKPQSPVQQNFLKEHFETLSDTCHTGNYVSTQSSISSRFLAQGSSGRRSSPFLSKTIRKSDRGPSVAVKPLSAVRPHHEERSQGPEEGRAEPNLLPRSTPNRRKVSGAHPSKVFSPAGKTSAGLMKSLSAHNLSMDNRKSATSSRLKRDSRSHLPQLSMERSDSRVHMRQPSPTGSCSPQPWESPSTGRHLKAPSYMSPTTSSIAKVNRSVPIEDAFHFAGTSSEALSCSLTCQSPSSPPCASSPPHLSPSTSMPITSQMSLSGSRSPPPKTVKSYVSSGTCDSLLENPSRSSPPPSADMTSLAECFSVHGKNAAEPRCSKSQVPEKQPVSPTSVSQSAHERPLVAVQTFTVTSEESQTDQEPSVNLETCRQAAAELCASVKKTIHLYRMVRSCVGHAGAEQQEMERLLAEALLLVRSELDASPRPGTVVGSAEGGERTLALLEQYSQLLLQSVEKRLDHKN